MYEFVYRNNLKKSCKIRVSPGFFQQGAKFHKWRTKFSNKGARLLIHRSLHLVTIDQGLDFFPQWGGGLLLSNGGNTAPCPFLLPSLLQGQCIISHLPRYCEAFVVTPEHLKFASYHMIFKRLLLLEWNFYMNELRASSEKANFRYLVCFCIL